MCTRSGWGWGWGWGVLLLTGVLTPVTRAAEHWVAPNGRDASNGSVTMPWATLQHAADCVRPGDVVTVRAGQYAGFDLRTDGTAARPITFRADPGAVIGARNERTPDGINLEGADHIIVEGFQVTGTPRAGIRSVLNRNVIIRASRTNRNGYWGIYLSHSDDALIEGNLASRSRREHGIYVSNSSVRPTIRCNTVWGNHSCGIHLNGDASQGGTGLITGALVEGNVIYDNGAGGGSGINCDGVQGSRIQNNLLYNNHASGISLFRADGGGGSTNNVVVNNTVVNASDGRWVLNIKDGSAGNTIRNNILLTLHPYRGSILVDPDSRPGFSSDYNLMGPRMSRDGGETVLDLGPWQALGYDAHSVVWGGEPVFVDPAAGDYRPRAGSPAVDAAEAVSSPPTDLEGNSRPAGARPDIGAVRARHDRPRRPAADPVTQAERRGDRRRTWASLWATCHEPRGLKSRGLCLYSKAVCRATPTDVPTPWAPGHHRYRGCPRRGSRCFTARLAKTLVG